MVFMTPKELTRFAKKTEWDGKCLIWTGFRNHDGYGHVTLRRESWKAHRLAYTDAWGVIPKGMLIRHTCDNPSCVNPGHLEIGTNADNAKDKAIRHRTKVKLSDAQILQIRADQDTQRKIASKFFISPAAVCLIKSGKRRIHVGE